MVIALDRRSAEEEEKRRQRKEQQNFRRQEQRRKKQEENERRKQRYQERKALKAALMEEEEREEEELELMATEDLRVQQLQAMEAKAKIGQLGEEHAKEIEEIVKRTNEEAIQMQLLTDIDRSAWIGSIVKDSFSNVVGRVLQYEDGFISIETVEDKVVGRPYEFEVLQPSNEEYQEFEFLKAMDQVANVVNRPKDALDELSGGDDDPDEVEDFQVEDAEGLANYQIGNQFPEKDDAANPNRGKVNLAFSSKKPVPKPKAPTMADIEVYAKERKAKLKEERELQQKRAAKLAELKKQQQEAEKEKELEQKRIAEEAQKAATKVQSPPDGQHSNSNNHRRVLVGDHANPSSYVANNSDSDIENEPIVVASSDYFDRPNPHQPAKPHIRQMHRSDSRDRYSNGGRGFYRGGYRDNRGDYRHNDYRGQGGRWHDDQRRQYSRDDYRRGDYESGEFHRGFRQQYLSSRDDQRLEHHQGRNQPFTLSTRQTEVAVPPPLVYKPDAMDLEDGIPSPPRQMPSSPEATCKLDRSEQDDQLHSVPPSPASSAEVVTLLDDKDDDIPEKSKEGIPTQSSWMVDLTDTDPQPAGMDLDLDIFTMTESRTDINVDEVQERIIFERKLAEEERVYEEEEKAARAIATSSTSSKVVVPSKVPPSGVVKKDISEVQFLEKRSSGIDRKRRSRSRSPPHRPDFKSRRSNSPPKFNRTPSSQVEPPRNNYIPPQSISNFDGRYREERSANSQFQSRHVEDRGGRLQGRFGPASRRGERGGRDNFSAGRGGRGGRGDFIRPTYDRYEDQFNKYLPPPNSDHLVNPNAAIVDALVVPAANASFSPIAEANSSSSSSSAVNTTEDIDDLFNRIRNMQAKASDESVGGAGLKADESSKPVVDHIATKYLADSSPYVEVIPSTSAIEISIAAQVEGVGEEYEPTSLDGVIYGDHKQSNVEGAAPLGLDDISQQLLQAYQQALLVQALNSDCGGDIAALIPNISDLANLVISPELLQALAQSITGPQSYTPGVDSAVMSLLQDQQQQPECVQEYEPTPPSNVANPPFINHGKPVSGQPSFHAKHTFNNSQYGPARSQSQGRGMGRDTHHQGSFSNKNDSQYRNQHSNPRYSSHQQQGQGQSNFHRGGGYEGERGRGDSQRGFSGRYPNRNESGGGPHRQPYRRY